MEYAYTHLVSFEKYNRFTRMWLKESFRTVAELVEAYRKLSSQPAYGKYYRNVQIAEI